MSKILYSRREAAAALGISITALDALATSGRLQKTKIGGRTMFHVDVLNEFGKTGTSENIRAAK